MQSVHYSVRRNGPFFRSITAASAFKNLYRGKHVWGLLLFVLLNSLTTINKKEKSQKAPLESDLHFNET